MKNFERPPESEQQVFNDKEALDKEGSLLTRFRDGKAGKLARSFMLMSALAIGVGAEARAGVESIMPSGGRQESSIGKADIKAEQRDVQEKKAIQERAINMLHQLYNLPNPPEAKDMAQAYGIKSEQAEQLIMSYAEKREAEFMSAGESTGGSTGYYGGNLEGGIERGISDKDFLRILTELNDNIGLFADRYFGDKDGIPETGDITRLNASREGNVGFNVLIETIQAVRQQIAEKESGAAKKKIEIPGVEVQGELGLLSQLYNVSDVGVARKLIGDYVFKKASGGKESMRTEDGRRVLEELNKATGLFADQVFGNKDGKVDIEEMNQLNKMLKDTLGFQVLIDVIAEYDVLKGDSF